MVTLALLVFAVILVGLFAVFIASTRLSQKDSDSAEYPTLSFDSQNIYRPIRSLRLAILNTVDASDDPAVRAMSGAVRDELKVAHDRVVLALQTRDQLRKASEGHASAQNDLARIEQQREAAESPQKKLSITKAYEAKTNELAEYDKAKAIIKKIEDEVELTKASLGELKAKLAVSGASANAAERAEDLRTTLGSLETIQSSVDEAQIMLRS